MDVKQRPESRQCSTAGREGQPNTVGLPVLMALTRVGARFFRDPCASLASFVPACQGMTRRPLLWICGPLLLGLGLFPHLEPKPLPVLAGAVACAALALRGGTAGTMALLAMAFLLGLAGPASLAQGPMVEGRVRVRGQVATGSSGRTTFLDLDAVAEATGEWKRARGRIELVFPEKAEAPGTQVVAMGMARPIRGPSLPGAPDSAVYSGLSRARSKVYVKRWVVPEDSRSQSPSFPAGEHPGLLRALVCGDRSEVEPEVLELFRNTGTAHLLAVSGLHIGLVATMAALTAGWLTRLAVFFWPLPPVRLAAATAAVLAAWAYGDMAGWSASASRAVVMTAMASLALCTERRADPWQLLGGACLVLVLWDPGCVTSPGWQLSFGAICGLLLVSPRLLRLMPPDLPSPLAWVGRATSASVAATLGTLPAAAWWFQDLSPVSPLANLLAVPLVGCLATPAALLSLLLPAPLDTLALWVADRSLDLVLSWLGLFQAPMLHPAVGGLGALLLLAALLLRRSPVAALTVAMLVLCLDVFPCDRLVLSFLAVGSGSATLVELPDGKRWLVDGGPSSQDVGAWLRRRGLNHLDAVVLTHPHRDHMNGLQEVLDTFKVDSFWSPRLPKESESEFSRLVRTARERGTALKYPGDPGLPVLHPLPSHGSGGEFSGNDESLVIFLQFGTHTVLLTGDIQEAAEAQVTRWIGPVDLLQVPHHGSASSSSPEFLEVARPRMAVISCGSTRPPSPDVLSRYRGVPLYRTDLDGTVQVSSDGWFLRVRTWKPGRGWRRLYRRTPVSPFWTPMGAGAAQSRAALPGHPGTGQG